jgi:hypothetical protein
MICMEYLLDLLVLNLRFRNSREKIYRNMLYSLNLKIGERKYIEIYGTSYLNLENI